MRTHRFPHKLDRAVSAGKRTLEVQCGQTDLNAAATNTLDLGRDWGVGGLGRGGGVVCCRSEDLGASEADLAAASFWFRRG